MGIFQKLNREHGITVLLITHEMDIAEYGTRFIRFRDGKIQVDQKITKRRDAERNSRRCRRPKKSRPCPAADRATNTGASSERARDCAGDSLDDMSIFMTLRIALKALNRNKLRTILTMLGMIVGVGAVITMVALGKGAQTPSRSRSRPPAPT
jgi:macrolide transport system ATP-binding/permease protein